MYDLANNNLYQHLQNPVFLRSNFSALPARALHEKLEDFKKKNKNNAFPDEEAVMFYLLNHSIHLFKAKYGEKGILSDEENKFVGEIVNNLNDICERLFFYIVIVSIEEARFLRDDREQFWDFILSSYGKDFVDYAKKGFSYDFKNVSCTADNFLNGIKGIFLFGKWPGGFGGKAWAQITLSARDVIVGKNSFELMADYGFSLCHNNGSMFNKGHLYSMYSNEIYDILDVQASGQIPQWINDVKKGYSTKVSDVYKKLVEFFPEEKTKKFNKKLLDDGAKKRREDAQKKLNVLASQANSVGFNNNNNTGPNGKPKPPEQKIDTLIIDAYQNFKKKNW